MDSEVLVLKREDLIKEAFYKDIKEVQVTDVLDRGAVCSANKVIVTDGVNIKILKSRDGFQSPHA